MHEHQILLIMLAIIDNYHYESFISDFSCLCHDIEEIEEASSSISWFLYDGNTGV